MLRVKVCGVAGGRLVVAVPQTIRTIGEFVTFLRQTERYATLFASAQSSPSVSVCVSLVDGFKIHEEESVTILRDGDEIRLCEEKVDITTTTAAAVTAETKPKKKRKRTHKGSKAKKPKKPEDDEDGAAKENEGEEEEEEEDFQELSKVTPAHVRKKILFDSDGEVAGEVVVEPELVVQGKRSGRKRKRSLGLPCALRPEKDVLTNVSIFLDPQNPPPPGSPVYTIQPGSSLAARKNFAELPNLEGTPHVGDVIAFRECFLSEKWVPELTDWKQGTVVGVDAEAKAVMLVLEGCTTPHQSQLSLLQTPKIVSASAGPPAQPPEAESAAPPPSLPKPTDAPIITKANPKVAARGVGGLLALLRRDDESAESNK
jgi:hypothetical protein